MSVNAIICIIVSLGISGYFWLCGNVLVSYLKLNKFPRMGIGLIINALMMTTTGMFIQDGHHYWMVMVLIILIFSLFSIVYFLHDIRRFNWKQCIIGLTILSVVSIVLFWNFRIKAYTLGTLSPAIDQVELLMNGYANNEVVLSHGSLVTYCQWFDQMMIGILQLVLPIAGFENLVFVLTYTSALLFFFLIIDIGFAISDGLTKSKLIIGLIIAISVYLGFYYDLNHYYLSFMPMNWYGLIIGISLMLLYQIDHKPSLNHIVLLIGLITVLFGLDESIESIAFVIAFFVIVPIDPFGTDRLITAIGFTIGEFILLIGVCACLAAENVRFSNAVYIALFVLSLSKLKTQNARKIVVIITGLCWVLMLIASYIFNADILLFGIYQHAMYPGYFNFIEVNAWMGLVLIGFSAFMYIKSEGKALSFGCWMIVAGNSLILYLSSIHQPQQMMDLPVLVCNSFLIYFVLIEARERLNHVEQQKLNMIAIGISGLMLFLSTDAIADVNQVYVSKEIKSFDYYNRLDDDIKDMVGHTNAYIHSKGWDGQTIPMISQMEFTRAYIPNIKLLFDYDMVYNHCQYCDVNAMDMHQPDPLSNIFAVREYADNRLFIEQPMYEKGCELVKSNDYRLFIFDKNQFYNEGTNYFPINNVLSGCSNSIYENQRYGLYGIK